MFTVHDHHDHDHRHFFSLNPITATSHPSSTPPQPPQLLNCSTAPTSHGIMPPLSVLVRHAGSVPVRTVSKSEWGTNACLPKDDTLSLSHSQGLLDLNPHSLWPFLPTFALIQSITCHYISSCLI